MKYNWGTEWTPEKEQERIKFHSSTYRQKTDARDIQMSSKPMYRTEGV